MGHANPNVEDGYRAREKNRWGLRRPSADRERERERKREKERRRETMEVIRVAGDP